MRKPNSLLHMTLYGFIYGLLLAMLYIWGFLIISESGADVGTLFASAYFAFIFGALPGVVMGFVEGIILWFIVRGAPPLSDEATFKRTRNWAYGIVGSLTFLGMGAILMLLFGSQLAFLTILPPFIAAATALYAVRRYLLKLRAWDSVGKIKNKARHSDEAVQRLQDKSKDKDDVILPPQIEALMRNRK